MMMLAALWTRPTHGSVAEQVGRHHLHQLPSPARLDPQFERRPHGLALDAGQGHAGQSLVVGMDDVDGVGSRQLRRRASEEAFGGVIGPQEPAHLVDDDDGVRQ
jgi:hypothetical protein